MFEALHTEAGGLSAGEAARRLREDGPNVLPEVQPDGYALIFLRQFRSPLIYILLAASGIVFLMGEVIDGSIILAVLLFNATVGTVQEGRAQNTLRALKKFVETTATVLRDGQEVLIPDREVVRGDILILQDGEKVSADARVLIANSLKIDEASLTGESEPVSKITERIHAEGLPASEQHNMVFKGTHVVVGNGRAIVVGTGVATAIGKIAMEISTIDSETPLKANIRQLSRAIIAFVGVVSLALFLLGLAKGASLVTIFATVVSLAVSIIPEGLPIVITLVLATGVWRMSKRNALVKKLQAVEALGQAQIIAVDKTGTITKNELVIREVWTDGKVFKVGGVGYEPKGSVEFGGAVVDAANHPELLFAGKIATLCASARVSYSEAESRWRVAGDPTEAAMRILGEKVGFTKDDLMRESPLLSEIPFDYRLKYHAAVYNTGGRNFLAAAGAPETILALCTHMRRDGLNHPLHKKDAEELEAVVAEMSRRGLRVVAAAAREHTPAALTPESVHDLTFVGFFGMQDVLRPEVAGAMERATAAGIRVVMITGDHKLTAHAVALEAGVWHKGDEILTGAEVDGMLDAELAARLPRVSVFARVTPEHKLRIINAYKKRGEIVAMTGDGVNDAPSLVAADLGVAMGKIGTEVAKEAADIVLLDDNFGSIVSAVEEGRNMYATIQKVMLFLLSTSLGEVLVILGALLLGWPIPLSAPQILWMNLVTDSFVAFALALDSKEEGLLQASPVHKGKFLIDRNFLVRMFIMSAVMTFGGLLSFGLLYAVDLARAWTMTLTVLAMFQWLNGWNCRSKTVSVFEEVPWKNKYLVIGVGVAALLHVIAIYTPFFQKVLDIVPLNWREWAWCFAVAFLIIIFEELRKGWLRRIKKKRNLQLATNS